MLQYEILAVDSDTKIRIATNATTTINNSEYAIVTTVANSYSALARQTSANLAVYEKLLSDWNHITTGTGNVTIIAPDGTSVIMPSFNQMNININSKLPLAGGTLTGGLVLRYSASITLTPIDATAYNWIHWTQVDGSPGWRMGRLENNGPFYLRDYSAGGVTALSLQKGQYIWTTGNTTVDSNGFLKRASPVIKLYGNGSAKMNLESAGAAVERLSEGVYKISGVLGFNSDDSWGGVDGGIEIPTDKNKQPLIWIDYEIDEGGDLIIKTYHRTHPASPVFAQNNIKDYEDGQPIDIPAGRFVDLRVQMPGVEEIEPPLTEA